MTRPRAADLSGALEQRHRPMQLARRPPDNRREHRHRLAGRPAHCLIETLAQRPISSDARRLPVRVGVACAADRRRGFALAAAPPSMPAAKARSTAAFAVMWIVVMYSRTRRSMPSARSP